MAVSARFPASVGTSVACHASPSWPCAQDGLLASVAVLCFHPFTFFLLFLVLRWILVLSYFCHLFSELTSAKIQIWTLFLQGEWIIVPNRRRKSHWFQRRVPVSLALYGKFRKQTNKKHGTHLGVPPVELHKNRAVKRNEAKGSYYIRRRRTMTSWRGWWQEVTTINTKTVHHSRPGLTSWETLGRKTRASEHTGNGQTMRL